MFGFICDFWAVEFKTHQCNPIEFPRSYEEDLIDFFPALVADLDFEEVAVRMYDDKPIQHPEYFGFLALSRSVGYTIPPGNVPRTLMSSGHVDLAGITQDVSFFYPGGKAYLDTWNAIGLTYLSKLVAVSGAGIDADGHLKIVQIQDVSDVRKGARGSDYYRTGLHNGLDWRRTLAVAWEHLAVNLGINEVMIESSINTSYGAMTELAENGNVTNDDVASQLMYDPDPQTNNWFRSLVV